MKKKLVALILGAGLVFTSCGQETALPKEDTSQELEHTEIEPEETGKEEVEQEDNEKKDVSDTGLETEKETAVEITYENESDVNTAPDGTEIYRYDYSYPVVTIKGNQAASEAIAKDQQQRKEKFMEGSKENQQMAEEGYNNIEVEEDQDYFEGYREDISYQGERKDDKVISFVSSYYAYLGGAHGSSYMEGVNYDVKTGKVLTLEDIFTDREAAMEEIKAFMLEQCESPSFKPRLFPDYEDYLDDVLTDEYWYFSEEGIHVISNEYMLGTYAAGSFEFIIPYEELTELKEEYAYTGVYVYPVINGFTIEKDLDSDGQKETICYSAIEPEPEIEVTEDGEEYSVYGSLECSLKINDVDVTEQFLKLTGYIPESGYDYYYLTDLDENDNYIELAILDYGVNDYAGTYFLRYDKGELKYLGYINALLNSQMCEIKGDGTLKARIHSQLLETADLEGSYHIEDGKLVLEEQDWYEYKRTEWAEEYMKNHNILKDVTVYTKNDISSEKKILTSEDGPVTFPATDNKNWVQVETAGGDTYYLYMENFGEINNDGVIENSADVFENLLIAG